ncbi:hypothetical protein Bbelb_140710 [Branchiostoma belcheri]|nr:hypothetical protein Bbelb_140710 [Branchiostoma belcheri]
MRIKLMAKISLLLLMQLLVPCVDAGSWQSCREVSVAKCGVGDSRSDGHEYRYDIGAYRYKWTKYPREVTNYLGPFQTVPLSQTYQTCQICSNETSPTQGGPTQNPLPQARTSIVIVGNDVGTLGTDKAEILSKIPCGKKCRLWFVGCNLTTIEVGAFAKLPQVSTLVIWRSNVQTLKNGTFAGMGRLEYLLLLENNLTHLEDGCFHGLPRLSFLILVDNQILTLSPGAFLGVQPRWVDVSANLITTVAPGTLQAIKSVEHVRAVENKLRSIGVEMFYGLERLQIVNLEGNRISHIAVGAFHSNRRLNSVNLAGNRLTFLSGGWFKSLFPNHVNVRGNAIAAMSLEGNERKYMVISLDNPPRCTCANDWLYDHEGMSPFKFKRRYARVMRVPSAASCPASPLMPNPPAPVNPNGLPCPVPLVEVTHVERSAAYKYEAAGDVYWEQLPTAEGWVKCKGSENLLGETGNHSLCSSYMGKSSFTLWLETGEPLSFGNTTCAASSKTGSDTAVFLVSERAHSDMTTPQATELTLLNTTPFSVSISTTPLSSGIHTTPLATGTSADAGVTWCIVWTALGGLSAVAIGVWGCAMASCIKQKLKRKAPDNGTGPSGNGNQIAARSMWPFPGGNSEESVISPYAEGRLEDHDSLNESESVISPYAEGGFNDHPDLRRANSSRSEIAPYGLAKLCPAYRAAIRPRTHTHPVPSRLYSTERPRLNRNRAVLAACGQNGHNKSGQSCYQHPSILPNPGATKSSAYQQNARAAQPACKALCYNSPALATDLKRTLSNTYDQHDPSEAVCNSTASPWPIPTSPPPRLVVRPAATGGANRYVCPSPVTGTQSVMYDENHPIRATTGGANRYICPSPMASAQSTMYDGNHPSQASTGGANRYVCPSPVAGAQSTMYDENHPSQASTGGANRYVCPSPVAGAQSVMYDENHPSQASTGGANRYVCPSPVAGAQSVMYDENHPSQASTGGANRYVCPSPVAGAQSVMYDENHPSQASTGGANRYVCPTPVASAGGSQAGTYCQNDRRESVNNTPENPETNSYEPASANSQIQ